MKTASRRIFAAALALAVALALATAGLWGRAHRAAPTPPPEAGALRWAPGDEYTYRVQWQTESTFGLGGLTGGRPLSSSARVEGDLVVQVFEARPGRTLVSARLANLSEAHVALADHALGRGQATADSLQSARALLEVDERGTIGKVAYENDPTGLGQLVLRGLLLHLNLTLPSTSLAPAEVVESGPSGTALASYVRRAGEPTVLERRRLSYPALAGESLVSLERPGQQKLRSGSEIHLGADGTLRALDDSEELVAPDGAGGQLGSKSRLSLRLASRARGSGGERPALSGARDLGEIPAPRLSREILRKRAAGLTGERMVEDLQDHAAAGFIPEEHKWYWRATGLLELQPELCANLVPLFRAETAGLATRAFLMDLLSGVGSPQAQAAMRDALASPEAQEDPRGFGDLALRFSFVRDPEPETLAFVQSLAASPYAKANGFARRTLVFSLGAMTGRALVSRPDLGRALHASLLEGLAGASDDEQVIDFLGALGNAAVPEDAPAIGLHAADSSPHVRAQVVFSVRHLPRERAVPILLPLAGDAELMVQMEAVRQLGKHPLFERDLAALADLVARGVLLEESYPYLLEITAASRSESVTRMLEQIAADERLEMRTRVRARDQLAAKGPAIAEATASVQR